MNRPAPESPPPVSVFLVEDQALFRSFLENWIGSLEGFVIAGSFGSGEEALLRINIIRPHLALVDLQLPGMDGIALAQALRQVHPTLRTLFLTSMVDPLTLTRVKESGMEGFLEKNARPEELAEAIRMVAGGGSYFSRHFHESLTREGAGADALGKILSRREQQVLSSILTGRTNRETAELIGLSARTVEFHRANIMTKLGAGNLTELLNQARRRGFSE